MNPIFSINMPVDSGVRVWNPDKGPDLLLASVFVPLRRNVAKNICRLAEKMLRAIADCVQENLLAIQVSYLIPDMINVWETVATELEISIKAFVTDTSDSHAGVNRSAGTSRGRKAPRASRG